MRFAERGVRTQVTQQEQPIDFKEPLPEGVQDLRPWFIAVYDLPERIDWSTFWGNDNRIELDVGCGRGLFLHNASGQNPEAALP